MTQQQFVERGVELETRATVPNCWPAQNMTGLSDQRRSKLRLVIQSHERLKPNWDTTETQPVWLA